MVNSSSALGVVSRARAIFAIFFKEGLRLDCSIPEIYVRSSPALSASFSCDIPNFLRRSKMLRANVFMAWSDVTDIHLASCFVEYKSTDYKSHVGKNAYICIDVVFTNLANVHGMVHFRN